MSIPLAEQLRRRFAKVLAHGHQEAGAIPARDSNLPPQRLAQVLQEREKFDSLNFLENLSLGFSDSPPRRLRANINKCERFPAAAGDKFGGETFVLTAEKCGDPPGHDWIAWMLAGSPKPILGVAIIRLTAMHDAMQ